MNIKKKIIEKKSYNDERIKSYVHKNSFETLVITFVFLICNIIFKISINENINQYISDIVILAIISCYFTFRNLQYGIFSTMGSIHKNHPKLASIKPGFISAFSMLFFNIIYNLLNKDNPKSYRFITFDCLGIFIVFYFLSYFLIKLSNKTNS